MTTTTTRTLLMAFLVLVASVHPETTVRHNRGLQYYYPEIKGTSAEEVCADFSAVTFAGYEAFGPTCTCTGDNTVGYSASCSNKCLFSVNGKVAAVKTDALLVVSTIGDEGYDAIYHKLCYDFTEDGTKMCTGTNFSIIPTLNFATVNGEECNMMETVDCGTEDGIAANLIDCANLGYGNAMNFCDRSTLQDGSPFAFAYDVNVPSEDPSQVLGRCDDSSSSSSGGTENASPPSSATESTSPPSSGRSNVSIVGVCWLVLILVLLATRLRD